MAAASVLIPLSTIEQNAGVLPPSALVQHAPRHGRSRAASMKGKNSRGGRYSVLENRDVSIAKAVTFVLKRSVRESEVDEDDEEDDGETSRLISNDDGWVSVDDLVRLFSSSHDPWEFRANRQRLVETKQNRGPWCYTVGSRTDRRIVRQSTLHPTAASRGRIQISDPREPQAGQHTSSCDRGGGAYCGLGRFARVRCV